MITGVPPKRTRLFIAAVLLAGLALRLVFMHISLESLPVTADEAMVVLQAKQIARDDRPLLFMAQPYQFPLGAYIMAPLVKSLPRTPLGARGTSLALGLASFLGIWLLLTRLGPASRTWPGLLLAAFPSSYLLIYQAAYSVPQYDFMLALWCLAAWLCWLARDRSPAAALGLTALVGLVAGLALSVHMLALSLMAPLALAACLGGGLRRLPARAGAMALGLVVGISPFLAAQWAYPEAAQQVAGIRPLEEIFQPDWLGGINHAMAGALGAFCPTFPDFQINVSPWAGAEYLFPLGFVALLLACAAAILRSLFAHRGEPAAPERPDPIYQAVFVLAPWLGLALFLLNERSNSGQYRYLLVLAWCLPFLMAQLFGQVRRWSRFLVGGAAILLAAFNLLTSLTLMGVWAGPNFAARHAWTADIGPVLDHLRRHGITHCFASYGTAYRITFASDEKIVCSQPLNERFPGWPVPYKDEVLRDPRAAYVLTSPDSFSDEGFERDLEAQHVVCAKTQIGTYHVYSDFRRQDPGGRVAADQISTRASHRQELSLRLNDGDPASRWSSEQAQEPGMWLEIWLPKPLPLKRLVMLYHKQPDDFPQGLRLLFRQEDQWRALTQYVTTIPNGFAFRNSLPVYGESAQELLFQATLTNGLRLEITKPNPDPRRYWSISEVELYFDPQAAGAASGLMQAAQPLQKQ